MLLLAAFANRLSQVLLEIWRDPRYRGLSISVVFVLASGTTFYHFAEGWGVIDSLYFSVVTLMTIGYGDFTPTKTISKLFTIFYIFVGVGLFATFIGTVADRMSSSHSALIRFRPRHHADEDSPVEQLAAEDHEAVDEHERTTV